MDAALKNAAQDREALARKPYLDPAEVAVYLGVGRSTAYELIKSGAIPSVRLGPRLLKVPTARLHQQLDGLTPPSGVSA